MNIIEAINSGKQFRRKSWGNKDQWRIPGVLYFYEQEDVIATDWEARELTVTITRSQLIETLNREAYLHRSLVDTFEAICKGLGL